MPVYEVKGLDAKGKAITRVVDAENERAARMKMRREGVYATGVRVRDARGSAAPAASVEKSGGGWSREVDLGKYLQRISSQDIATLTRQLSTLLGAGIPLVSALNAVQEQSENEKLKVILGQVKEQVNEGSSLADALGQHPKHFSELYVNMVRAGEQSGALELVLDQLSDYTEKQTELQGEVMGALFYPAVLGSLGVFIVIFLMAFVVPKIAKIFDDMDATLPLLTVVVIGLSHFLQKFWWLVFVMVGGAVYGARRWLATEKGKRKRDTWLLGAPVFGRLVLLLNVSRFGSTMSTLLAAGVPLLRALGIVENILGNVLLREAIGSARENISEGQSIARPLKASGRFPPLLISMIETGERTGELESMLLRVARSYEAEVDRSLKAMTRLIEPLLIIFMGGSVMVIALSILLPMMSINQLIS